MAGDVNFRERGEEMQPGYDFSFAPNKPVDPDYRQAYLCLQLAWLDRWQPRPESVH
jgi:hypothetical protein